MSSVPNSLDGVLSLPSREVDQYVQIPANDGTSIVYVFETHVHNDFVSGARELAEQTGCQMEASASGGLLFPSIRLQEDEKIRLPLPGNA